MNIDDKIIDTSPRWKNISIFQTEKDIKVLILICDSEEANTALYQLLSTSSFNIIIEFNKLDMCFIKIVFINGTYDMVLQTNKTEKNYPPIKWLVHQEVNFITTGFKSDDNKVYHKAPFLNLIRPALN